MFYSDPPQHRISDIHTITANWGAILLHGNAALFVILRYGILIFRWLRRKWILNRTRGKTRYMCVCLSVLCIVLQQFDWCVILAPCLYNWLYSLNKNVNAVILLVHVIRSSFKVSKTRRSNCAWLPWRRWHTNYSPIACAFLSLCLFLFLEGVSAL